MDALQLNFCATCLVTVIAAICVGLSIALALVYPRTWRHECAGNEGVELELAKGQQCPCCGECDR